MRVLPAVHAGVKGCSWLGCSMHTGTGMRSVMLLGFVDNLRSKKA